MPFKVIKKDFLPVFEYDDRNVESRFGYSYTGKEFDSIVGYVISDGYYEYWATEEDVLELNPDIDLSSIDDYTHEDLDGFRDKVLQIYRDMINYDAKVDVVKKIKKHTQDKFITKYMGIYSHIPF